MKPRMAKKATETNGLTKKQRDELHGMLTERRDQLLRNIDQRAETDTKVEPDQVVEELDQASATQSQAVSLRVMDKEVKLLKEINRALEKFDNDEYGLCEGSGEPIGYRRLKAVPWTRYSVEYKEQREQQQTLHSGRRPGR